jgi:hypothetical protein
MIKCWHYRRIISRSADENTPLTSAAQEHLTQCPDCRRLHEMEQGIARQLAAGAGAQRIAEAPHFIRSRILAQIEPSSSNARQGNGTSPFRWAAAAAVAIGIIVFTAILLWPNQGRVWPERGPISRVQPKPVPESVAKLELPNPKVLTQWATHPDQPLETEAKAMVHDARGAMTALADNFFPEKLRQTIFTPTTAEN